MVVYKKGHKNSQGEDAPWTIVSHESGKILSSHKSESIAKEHLRQMEYFKHAKNESFDEWISNQESTPLIEAAKEIYHTLFEN